ncbi:hypothetical protein L7F22_038197 [Adiantum nelumboides]|nr:hypothetical protein [Adiantum nelumboides]
MWRFPEESLRLVPLEIDIMLLQNTKRKGPICIGRDTPSLRARFSPLDSVIDTWTENSVVFQLMFAIEALLQSIRVPMQDIEEIHVILLKQWSVQVKPKFHEDANKIEVVVPFEESIKLESRDPAWVKCPEYLLLTHNGRTFNVVVDPSQLTPGLHCSEIRGIDCEAPWRGPVFRIPVTVLKPLELTNQPPSVLFKGMNFVPGHIERRFIKVPVGATWSEATMRVSGFDTPRRFYLNAVQLVQQKRPVVSESTFVLAGPSTKDFSFRVQGGITMELTVAQFWSSGSGSHLPANATVEIQFHGLLPCKDEVLLNGSDIATRIDVTSFVGLESISPRATLHTIRCPYRPVESKLQALPSDRDKLPSGHQILSLTLTYKFNLAEACKVTPRLPALNKRIYDNEFESQFYMIADVNKRILAMGDVYPKGVKLSKGDYTLRLHLRHDNIQYLEKLKKTVIFIDKSLEEKVCAYLLSALYKFCLGQGMCSFSEIKNKNKLKAATFSDRNYAAIWE